MRAAASAWPAVTGVLTGAAATAAAVSELAAGSTYSISRRTGGTPRRTRCSPALELVDGPWFGYDIDQLPAVPDVVLLSACELGRSSVRWGEELIGMTTAWLHAGTRCVVASAAAVSDEVAHDVLVRVHRGLGDGEQPATALAHALPAVGPDGPPGPVRLLRLTCHFLLPKSRRPVSSCSRNHADLSDLVVHLSPRAAGSDGSGVCGQQEVTGRAFVGRDGSAPAEVTGRAL